MSYQKVRSKQTPPWQSSIRPVSNTAFKAIIEVSSEELSKLESTSRIEQEGDPITALKLLNEKYESCAPQKREKLVNAHIDRGQSIINALKRILGAVCQICGTEGFEKRDGDRYIEAHHLTQLARSTSNSLCSDNIILLCPNCHRQIHYGKEVILEDRGNQIYIQLNGFKGRVIHKNRIDYLQSIT